MRFKQTHHFLSVTSSNWPQIDWNNDENFWDFEVSLEHLLHFDQMTLETALSNASKPLYIILVRADEETEFEDLHYPFKKPFPSKDDVQRAFDSFFSGEKTRLLVGWLKQKNLPRAKLGQLDFEIGRLWFTDMAKTADQTSK